MAAVAISFPFEPFGKRSSWENLMAGFISDSADSFSIAGCTLVSGQ
jgi:hypothetical protein